MLEWKLAEGPSSKLYWYLYTVKFFVGPEHDTPSGASVASTANWSHPVSATRTTSGVGEIPDAISAACWDVMLISISISTEYKKSCPEVRLAAVSSGTVSVAPMKGAKLLTGPHDPSLGSSSCVTLHEPV